MKLNFDIYNLKIIFLNKLGIFASPMLKQFDILNSKSLIFLHLVRVLHHSMVVKLQSEIWLSLCRSIWLSPMSFRRRHVLDLVALFSVVVISQLKQKNYLLKIKLICQHSNN